MSKKTDIIKQILDYYKDNTKKDEGWFVEKFEFLSDQSESRLKNYFKILKQL